MLRIVIYQIIWVFTILIISRPTIVNSTSFSIIDVNTSLIQDHIELNSSELKELDIWNPITNMSIPRYGFAVFIVDEQSYITNGLMTKANNKIATSNVYNPSSVSFWNNLTGFIMDSDGDGLIDGDEVNKYKTDPLDEDSDGDGYSDGEEVAAGKDPLDPLDYPMSEDTGFIIAIASSSVVLLSLIGVLVYFIKKKGLLAKI